MIYMPGGRSLVNNSIFNLVLMLAGLSPTSNSLPPSPPATFLSSSRSLYLASSSSPFSSARSYPPSHLASHTFTFIPFLSSPSSALIPPCRRSDENEISTASANKFLHRALVRSPSLWLVAYFSRSRFVIKSGRICWTKFKIKTKKEKKKQEERGGKKKKQVSVF